MHDEWLFFWLLLYRHLDDLIEIKDLEATSNRLLVKKKGVLKVPGLINGQTYYYRLRSRKQWGFKSEWSPEYKIVPDGGLNPPPPEIIGIIKQGRDAIVNFKPVPKAVGYKIVKRYADAGDSICFINAAGVQYAVIPGFDNAKSVYMCTVNQNGESAEVHLAF